MSDLITLRQASLHYGHKVILQNIDWVLRPGERICLIGRNGEGKSTLFRVLQGLEPLDEGERLAMQGLSVAALSQEVPQGTAVTVFDVVLAGLGDVAHLCTQYMALADEVTQDASLLPRLEAVQAQIEQANAWELQHRVQTVLSRLSLSGHMPFDQLSGGLKRRVLLAQALVKAPDVLLLDEPTNHLGLAAIQWLENFLSTYPGCLVFITHDRTFLRRVATRIVELTQGQLLSFAGDYERFMAQKQSFLDAKLREQQLFDKKLQQEEAWIRQGIKARRTRNEGRVRALKAMREQRQARVAPVGRANLQVNEAQRSGQLVVRAESLGMLQQDRWLFRHFDFEVMKGDKIGIVGPNGVGKTTLLDCLLKRRQPTEGTVTHGSTLEVVYFDQLKMHLREDHTLLENVAGGSEFVDIQGKRKHAVGYSKTFYLPPGVCIARLHNCPAVNAVDCY